MMCKIVNFTFEDQYINDFLSLPQKLYSKKYRTQNIQEEKELLLDKHILSKYFNLFKFLIYKNETVVTRCILTVYPNDTTLYFGFFESFNDEEAVKLLFDSISHFATSNHLTNIVGPVDASFWIKYRLKTNHFDKKPYIGEPYNKDYYLSLMLMNNYRIAEEYVSNSFPKYSLFNRKILSSKKKYDGRFKKHLSKGYSIVSPTKDNFEKVLREIYGLIMELYTDFPIFKYIAEEDFISLFSNYKYILDYSMVKMAYFNDEPVGFFIGTPDYSTMLYHSIGILTYIKVFFKRIRSSNYVMLYMGVKKEHQGLGKALVKPIITNVLLRLSGAVTALTKEGRATKTYFEQNAGTIYSYALLEKKVEK